ncbi:hypothetical protein A2Z00_05265 [Candidatus Gottesmanbacteria bacterium RBG_13_45_10]|uniref:O-antigen ligase-related domain-containing protein n=1 Tax=Candidatus Gottesmanbacteria bacterium RBG_13_45_10 TaxID=1798370 RepID=A0A1F5ZI16_9BACT|nr:MAG: hypothetical protein A2Z00_05265 [Candidatus Gottesmanbacteria bacterium RBG_13_45_10]
MRIDVLFFSLLLLFFPTQLGYHLWPNWSMVLGRRVDYLSPTFYFTDILLLSAVGTYILFLLLTRKKDVHLKLPGRAQLSVWMLAVGFVLVNIILSQNRAVSLYKWTKVVEYILLGWYIVQTKPRINRVITLLSIGVIYSAVIGIGQFFLQRSIGGILWFLGERTFTSQTPGISQIQMCFPFRLGCPLLLRSYATLPHPNVLAGFIATALPLSFQLMIKKGILISRFARTVTWLAFLCGGVALFFTFSRSAWVMCLAAVGWIIWTEMKKRKNSVIHPHWFPLLLLLLLLVGILIFQRIAPDSESISVRNELNIRAIQLIERAPLFGVGLGNFLTRLPEILPSRTIYFLQPVHNIYLLLLSETGIVGFLFFILLVARALRSDVVRIPLTTLLVLGFVDHYVVTLQQGQLLIALLLALSIATVPKQVAS